MRTPLSALFLSAILATISCSGPSATAPTTAPAADGFTLTGTVVAQFGHLAGGQVSIVGGSSAGKTAAVSSNGQFQFRNLAAGPLSLQAASDGYAPQVLNLSIPTNQTVQITLTPVLFKVTGLVTDADTSAPVPNANVGVNKLYPGRTDANGRYVIDSGLDGALGTRSNIVSASADGYDYGVAYVMSATQNLHLHRPRTITLGAPVQVTVTPDDSLCENDAQEPTYGFDVFLCRALHATAPSDGVITVEAVSTAGTHYALYVTATYSNADGGFISTLANPATIAVKAGFDITIWVEQPIDLTTPTTFTVTTAFTASGP